MVPCRLTTRRHVGTRAIGAARLRKDVCLGAEMGLSWTQYLTHELVFLHLAVARASPQPAERNPRFHHPAGCMFPYRCGAWSHWIIGSPPCQCLLLAQRVVQPGAKDLLCTRARELSVSLRLHARHECGCGAMHPHAGTAGVYYPSPPLSPPPCLVVLPLVGVVNPARTHMRTTHTDNSRTQQV